MSYSELDISPLVPERYAGYRPVVAAAFAFFLEHLTPQRLEEIYAVQTRLPSEASLHQRFATLIRCCPTLHLLALYWSLPEASLRYRLRWLGTGDRVSRLIPGI